MSKRENALYINDIIVAIDTIVGYVHTMSFSEFEDDKKSIDAVVRNIEIIGEASTHISEDLKIQHPKIPWKKMISMRNKIIHEYFGIDNEILWETIQNDLPLLSEKVKQL
ncbi:MAG: DUF86 domain-containing protein [Patescibacteria group bacterium]